MSTCTSHSSEGKGRYGSFRLRIERVGVQVKLCNPLRTRAIRERFCGGDSLRTGAISSVRTFTFLPLTFSIVADPTFDLLPPVNGHLPATPAQLTAAGSVLCQNNRPKLVCNADALALGRRQSKKNCDADVSCLVSSEQWLKIYGLKTAKLDMNHLLRQIGFRHFDGKRFCVLIY